MKSQGRIIAQVVNISWNMGIRDSVQDVATSLNGSASNEVPSARGSSSNDPEKHFLGLFILNGFSHRL